MKCAIIDDEPLAIEVVKTYLEQVGGMEIILSCTNPLEAISELNKHQVDLVFLDIEMPNLNGIELVTAMDNLPQFIFTTAYPEYALDGFNLNATDYLVKPIPFHRFLKAISRAREKHEIGKSKTSNMFPASPFSNENRNDFIFVKSEYENIKINTADIKYIQGLKDYIKIYVANNTKAILTLSSFKDIMGKLPETQFLRIHRSFIVNVSFITALQKSKVIVDKMQIPIGETYRKEVLERLKV